jgi:hypothetical protein
MFKNYKKTRKKMTTTKFGGGGVRFPNILTSNEEKKKIVRIMKLARQKT